MKRGPVILGVVVVLLLVSLTALPGLIRLTASWYWFTALELQTVFLTTLWTKIGLGFGVGLIAFGFSYANLRLAQRGLIRTQWW